MDHDDDILVAALESEMPRGRILKAVDIDTLNAHAHAENSRRA